MKLRLESANDMLTADQRGVVEGYETKGEKAFRPDSVPPALVEGTDGATAAMIAARDIHRLAAADMNVKMADQLEQLRAELKNELHLATRPC